jgi:type IV pilus assembly protein PilB
MTLDTTVGELPWWKGAGCDHCAGTGLKGRQGLYEVMVLSGPLRKQILRSPDAAALRDAAVGEGMLTLRMDGWLKVLKGVTTLEQVIRETSA